MGLSKSKTKTKNEPWAPAQPYILKGLENSGRVFDAQQPNLDKFSGMQMDSYARLAPGAEQGIAGAQGLVNANLSGANLNGNPYLDAILAKTRGAVTDSVSGQFSGAGRYGSGMHAAILAREIANAENQARFQNYGMERGYQQAAIGDAQNLMGGAQGMLNNAAELPWIGVGALNGNVRQASNGYGTTTTKQSQAWGPALLSAAGQAAGAFAAGGSDIRLKVNIERVGQLADGLPVYEFDYIDPPNAEIAAFMGEGRQRGVMAHEVAELRPWALAPDAGGYSVVNYGAL